MALTVRLNNFNCNLQDHEVQTAWVYLDLLDLNLVGLPEFSGTSATCGPPGSSGVSVSSMTFESPGS